jgi:hypothetical protein
MLYADLGPVSYWKIFSVEETVTLQALLAILGGRYPPQIPRRGKYEPSLI